MLCVRESVRGFVPLQCWPRSGRLYKQGSYRNKEIKFQYTCTPGWIELNFEDISDAVYRTSIAINSKDIGNLSLVNFYGYGDAGQFIILHH